MLNKHKILLKYKTNSKKLIKNTHKKSDYKIQNLLIYINEVTSKRKNKIRTSVFHNTITFSILFKQNNAILT